VGLIKAEKKQQLEEYKATIEQMPCTDLSQVA
jgi:hypothetical protein